MKTPLITLAVSTPRGLADIEQIAKTLRVSDNNPNLAGSLASGKVLFGRIGSESDGSNRFAVYAIHTRFDAVQYVVADAERIDELGLPTIVRQEPTLELALGDYLDDVDNYQSTD